MQIEIDDGKVIASSHFGFNMSEIDPNYIKSMYQSALEQCIKRSLLVPNKSYAIYVIVNELND